jgi:dTDP-4-dehydrorhamnose reductase
LTDWIINSILEKREIKVFDDIFVTPLHLLSLCDAIEAVVVKGHRGIFNLGCSDGKSKAFLAIELAKKIGIGQDLIKLGLSSEANLIAQRPKDMRMISDKFVMQFNYSLPSFESQIDMTAQEFKNAQTSKRIDN